MSDVADEEEVAGGAESSRPRAEEIYLRVKDDARDELERPARALAFSALFAGFTIGASGFAVAAALATVHGASAEFIAALLYPIGFIAVILGRGLFFTENTLYPVVASLDDPRCIPDTARLWAIVFAANIAGTVVFALLVVESGGVSSAIVGEFGSLGAKLAAGGFVANFWSAVLAGWLLALVAWLVEASEAPVGQVLVIASLTSIIGIASLDHCVATTVEVLGAVFDGKLALGPALGWLGTVTLGNIVGGVTIVSLLNYGQVRERS